MHELSAELGRFIGGGITLDQLRAVFRDYLARHHDQRDQISRWLRRTVEEGRLSVTIWLSLRDLFEDPPPDASLPDESVAAVAAPATAAAAETLLAARATAPRSIAARSAEPRAEARAVDLDVTLCPGMVVRERFVLVEKLGSGGMGEVFKARDLRREEARDRHPFVALKVLNKEVSAHPDSFMALQREARRASMLAHPNVVTVYDFDRDGPRIYMTMEYLEGQRLDAFMSAEGGEGLPLEKAWPVIRGVGLALEYGHEKRIVHSDLKPGNIFVCEDGAVKVLDFGIARLINPTEGHGEATIFDPRTRLGGLTPAYASPEMWGREPPDPRDDIYALAVVTYELLSGKHPFDRLSAKTAAARQLTPPRIEGLSRAQWEALRRGLALRREERTPTVADFVRPFAPRSRMRRYALPAAAAAVLVTAGALAVSARFYRDAVEDSTLEVLQCAQIPKPVAAPAADPASRPTQEQLRKIDEDVTLAADFMREVTRETPIADMKYILTDGANSVNYILENALSVDATHAEALRLKSDVADLYAGRATALLEQRRIDEAHDLVRKAREVLPGSVEMFRLEQTVCRAAAAQREAVGG